MDKQNNAVLRQIMDDLKSGYTYGKDYTFDYYHNCPYRFPFFKTCLSVGYGRDFKQHIYWEHYGSSANKCTLKDLEWIITAIFQTTPVDFPRQYIRSDQSKIE